MKKRVTIYSIIACLVIFSWAWLVFLPELNRQNQAKAELVKSRTSLTELQSTAGQLPGMINTKDLQSNKVDEIQSQIFSKNDFSLLCDRLRDIATSQKLKVVDISPSVEELLNLSKKSNSNELQHLSLTLQLNGNYLPFGTFVDELRGQSFFHTFNRCIITDAQDESGRLNFTLGFSILINTTRGQS